MRRLLFAPFAALMLVALATPAAAYIGHDDTYPSQYLPVPDEFTVIFEEVTQPVTVYDSFTFDRSRGWDFGDREGYQCETLEAFDGTDMAILFEFEINEGYQDIVPGGETVRWEDQGGGENNDGPSSPAFPTEAPEGYTYVPNGKGGFDVCGAAPGEGSWEPSGEDHFPHIIEGHDPAMQGIVVYLDGVVQQAWTDDLNAFLTNTECDRAYWSPGDEPGEFVLWWDEDFPENAHHDGSAPLDCGGGGEEPFAAARLFVKYVDVNAGVCVLDADAPGGQVCQGMTEPAPEPTPEPTPSCTPNPKTGECPEPKG